VIWGCPYLLIRIAVRELSPAQLVFFRTLPAALLLLPFALHRGELGALVSRWRWLLAYTLAAIAVPWPVLAVAGVMFAGLMAVSGAYGFHGDEMYFVVAGQHPAFGYVDQPPLTPLLSAASVALFGVSPTAVRLLPAIEMAFIVIVTALIARDLGGSRRAQILASITTALAGYLGAGHLDTTTDPDLLAWAMRAVTGAAGWSSAWSPGSAWRTRTRSCSWGRAWPWVSS